jgi:sensor c-di-GMP phosphodiesterase-like protein
MKILVIDDERFILSIVVRLLGKLGYEDVLTASDGQEAISAIERSRPDLIVSDLKMPSMDGIELIRKIAATPSPPVMILMSGEDRAILDAAERLCKALHLKLLGALPKPVELSALDLLLARAEALLTEQPPRRPPPQLAPDVVRAGIEGAAICPAYQPKVSIQTGKVIGAEALARWRDADGTIVSPAAFVPVAERHGMISQLTQAMIRATLAELPRLLEALPTLKVSINVSVDDLDDVTFADRLVAAADAAGIAPGNLVIEVTESRIMEDIIGPLDVLCRLRMKGFGLSIDDFGTGASGYQNLQILPFNELKIDRAFVAGTPHNEETRAILESIVFVAKKMKLTTVAEGVETREEWDLLAALGVDLVQGYFTAKPMFAEEFLSWNARRRST